MKRLIDKWDKAVKVLMFLTAIAYIVMTAYCMANHAETMFALFVLGTFAGTGIVAAAQKLSITAYKARKYDERRRYYHD